MSNKELCELLQEVFKDKEMFVTAILERCQKLSNGKDVLDIIFGSIEPEDYSYFRNCYFKLKQKEIEIQVYGKTRRRTTTKITSQREEGNE